MVLHGASGTLTSYDIYLVTSVTNPAIKESVIHLLVLVKIAKEEKIRWLS